MRDGGLRLSVTLPGATPAVPPDVGAAAYRIVQESLTNVLRHAGTGEASVRVAVDGGAAGRGGRPGQRARRPARAAAGSPACAGGPSRSAARCPPGHGDGGGFLVRAELPA